jgi:hypothetical protein
VNPTGRVQGGRELGEDREVDVQPHSLDPTHSQGQHPLTK